jgi:biotin carboxyl carrier protein
MVLRNLFRRRGRTALTLFGIAIGVAAMVALGAMANALREGFASMTRGSQADFVVTQAGAFTAILGSIDQTVADDLRAVPEVAAVDGMVFAHAVKWNPAIGARPEALQLEQATGAYNGAKARLEALLGPPAADVAAARAQLQQAQARLEAGARPEEIAIAEADVARARAALKAARLALSRWEIRAPFAGTVGRVHVRVGELVAPGQPRRSCWSGWACATG